MIILYSRGLVCGTVVADRADRGPGAGGCHIRGDVPLPRGGVPAERLLPPALQLPVPPAAGGHQGRQGGGQDLLHRRVRHSGK